MLQLDLRFELQKRLGLGDISVAVSNIAYSRRQLDWGNVWLVGQFCDE